MGLAMLAVIGLSSCTTTYDAYGRPVQSVDPAAVAIGAVALGATAYAIGRNDSYGYGYGGHGGHRRHPRHCR